MAIYGTFLYGAELYGTPITVSKKRFIYKIFDNGSFVTNWSLDVISEPSFTTVINGGPGELRIRLARDFDNFGEDVDVKLNNTVELYVYDVDDTSGLLLYKGYISAYAPILQGGREFVDVTVFPTMAEAQRFMLRESNGDTEVPFLSKDPSDIFTGVLNRFQADGGNLESTASSIQDTDTTVSYTFNTNTVKEAFDKCVELAPKNWFWSVDPDSTANFKEKPSGVTHDLSIGEHLITMQPVKRVENVVNRVYFTGGGDPPLYQVTSRSGSIDSLGLYAKKIVDQRVTLSATADTMTSKILDERDTAEVRTRLVIMDNNGVTNQQGYDIESIKVGDTVRIKNLSFGTKTESLWDVAQWDVDVWDQTLASVAGSALIVVKTRYRPNELELEASSQFPVVSKRIEDINRNLENTQTKDNPTSPS